MTTACTASRLRGDAFEQYTQVPFTYTQARRSENGNTVCDVSARFLIVIFRTARTTTEGIRVTITFTSETSFYAFSYSRLRHVPFNRSRRFVYSKHGSHVHRVLMEFRPRAYGNLFVSFSFYETVRNQTISSRRRRGRMLASDTSLLILCFKLLNDRVRLVPSRFVSLSSDERPYTRNSSRKRSVRAGVGLFDIRDELGEVDDGRGPTTRAEHRTAVARAYMDIQVRSLGGESVSTEIRS